MNHCFKHKRSKLQKKRLAFGVSLSLLSLQARDMNYLTLEHASLSYGDKLLFEDISLRINRGEKVALIARNGAGKSTLLRLLTGQFKGEGEHFRLQIAKGIQMGYLPQEPEFHTGWTVLDAVFEGDAPPLRAIRAYQDALLHGKKEEELQHALAKMDETHAWDIEARAKEILYKLEIKDLDARVEHLSGGQRKRVALARLILSEPDFLILDEPTNHLDLEMIEWLEGYLSRSGLTLLLVTHDRFFLERVCDRILELDGGRLYSYSGSYSDFLTKKLARHENEAVVLEKTRKLMKRELQWVRRMPQARTTKSKARLQKFEEIKEAASKKIEQQTIHIDIKGERLGSKILEAHYLSKAYGDKVILKEFNYKFRKGERVGVVGPNGCGKTTFLRLLTKQLRPDSGSVVVGGTVKFGYYGQDGLLLEEDKRVIDVITEIAEFIPLAKGQKLTAPQLLERFLFDRKQQQVYVSQLSGGEKRRLHLLQVLMQNPNFLVLDEPTNDLDIVTLNVLEDFLLDFPGCVLVVTHDRFFLDKVADHLFVFEGEGRIKDFNGRYIEYREQKIRERKEQQQLLQAEKKKEARAASANAQTPSAPVSDQLNYEQRKQVRRLEQAIARLEERKQAIHEKFNKPNLSPETIAELSKELDDLQKQIEEKEEAWMELVG